MPSTAAEDAVHVAAGVIEDRARFFVTRRLPNAHQGGKWEFPGGKMHQGESALTALRRELHEELGIDVSDAHPLMRVRHSYPDKTVLLDVWRVTSYSGTPHGREGQETRWISKDELLTLEFPEADRPIQRRLWLPRLYAITDVARYGRGEFLRRLEVALGAGLKLLQLREPGMNVAEYRQLAGELAVLCRRHQARLLLNTDTVLVDELGADGVHLNSRRLMQTTLRPLPEDKFVAASCHNEQELERAVSIGVDMVVLGPVAPTASHVAAAVLGWERFQALGRSLPIVVYALGGMRAGDIEKARECGAQGLAMIRGLWEEPDVSAVVRRCEGAS